MVNERQSDIGRRASGTRGGFGIVELVIAIGILLVITTIFLVGNASFGQRTKLDLFTHQVAQAVREAQVTAMSVRRATGPGLQFPAYGLHVARSPNNEVVIFADYDTDRKFDLNEGQSTTTFDGGMSISALCGESPNTTFTSGTCPGRDNANSFDIMFVRPNPDAIICGVSGGGEPAIAPCTGGAVPYSSARITVQNVRGHSRTIEVWITGQITTQPSP